MKNPTTKIKHVHVALSVDDINRKPKEVSWEQVILIGLDRVEAARQK